MGSESFDSLGNCGRSLVLVLCYLLCHHKKFDFAEVQVLNEVVMYIPKANQINDPETIARFIGSHGFANLITVHQGVPFASPFPVLHDQDRGVLWGHMARANEQWLHFTEDTEVLCIFSGPHAYISPRWYASEFSVPTWNYAVVHVYGMPEIIEEPEALRKIVDDTTAKYEQRFDTPWSMHLPEKAVDGMLRAIVGFSIKITRIEAKFKLGQNKSVEDQEAMLLGLESDSDPASNELAQFMKDYKP